MRFFVFVLFLSFQFSKIANGLKCYSCRLDICDHPYCDSAMKLFNDSSSQEVADYIGVQNLSSLATCPLDMHNNNTSLAEGIQQTCLNPNDTCGHLIFNITTKSVLNIVPNEKPPIPVIGSGTDTFSSSVIILGCIPEQYKCNAGFALHTDDVLQEVENEETTTSAQKQPITIATPPSVPSVVLTTMLPSSASSNITNNNATVENSSNSNSTSANSTIKILPGTESRLSHHEHVNSQTNCCHCEEDLCNDGNLIRNNNSNSNLNKGECVIVVHELVLSDQTTNDSILLKSNGNYFLTTLFVSISCFFYYYGY